MRIEQLKEISWAVMPGVIACLIILYQFYISSGEFIYLDWRGGLVSLWKLQHFFEIAGTNWLEYKAIPLIFLQVPFVLLFGYNASAIWSKTFFLTIFISASVGLHLFFKDNKLAYLLASAILFFSPFVYERIMMGQFGVVSSIFLAPLFIYFTKNYFENPTKKNALLSALFLTIPTIIQTHALLLHFILFGVLALFYIYLNKEKRNGIIHSLFWFFLYYVVLNIYWIIPFFVLPKAPIFSAIDSDDIDFFQPKASISFNTLAKTAMQFGAWRENGMLLSYTLLPQPFLLLVLFFFIFLSALATVENRSVFNYSMLTSAIIGFIFALGPISPLFNFAVDNVPLFSGFRDSNKFVELITLAYAFLVPIGLSNIIQNRKEIVFSLAILIVVYYNYPAIGLSNQLHPNSIPLEYYQIKNEIQSQALYLPKGIYLTYNWSLASGLDGRISNPVTKEGVPKIIVLTNKEDFGADNVYSNISKCSDTTCLLKNNVSSVVIDKCSIYPFDVKWAKENATLIKEMGCLTVYKIT